MFKFRSRSDPCLADLALVLGFWAKPEPGDATIHMLRTLLAHSVTRPSLAAKTVKQKVWILKT